MYNLIGTAEIKAFAHELADANPLVEKVLEQTLVRTLTKEASALNRVTTYPDNAPSWLTREKFQSGGPFYIFNAKKIRCNSALMEKINHVRDWALAAAINQETWLNKQDPRGHILRLLKISTLDAAFNLANKDMIKSTQRLWNQNRAVITQRASEEEAARDIQTIAFNPDGTRWVRLLTSQSLDRESARMGHCIGSGAYDERLYDKRFAYYSLRDGQNKPHVTLEVRENTLVQCQGKQNEKPHPRYLDVIQSFAIDQALNVNVAANVCGLVMGRVGNGPSGCYNVFDLPEKFQALNDLDLSGIERPFTLPYGLHVNGDLLLTDCTNLGPLPENLFTLYSLDVSNTPIQNIPSSTIVQTALCACNCRNLTDFPVLSFIGTYIDVSNTPISKIPDNLIVKGSLKVSDCPTLTELPKGLEVRAGSLIINGTSIKTFPADLYVNGGIFAEGCKFLTEIPENFSVDGEFDISYSGVCTLPNGLYVNGDLIATNCTDLSKIGKKIRIKGDLLIENTKIIKIPRSLVCDSIDAGEGATLSEPNEKGVCTILYYESQKRPEPPRVSGNLPAVQAG